MSMSDDAGRVLPSTVRRAALIDAGLGLLAALLLWPFPVARRVLPVAGNIVGIVLLGLAASLALAAMGLRRWSRTLGMRLAGVMFAPSRASCSPRAGLTFTALSILVVPLGWVLPSVFDPDAGLPSRGSGLRIVEEPS